MGILDDAIREHLDLKRKHGAREAELREIEDEALGSSEQPDPFAAGSELFAEEPTRLAEPEALRREPQAPRGGETAVEEPSREEPGIGPPAEEPGIGSLEEPASPPEGAAAIPGQTEPPVPDEIPGQERLDDAIEAGLPPVEPEAPPTSESLEELIAEEEPFPEDSAAPQPPDTAEEAGPSADRGGALDVDELEPQEEPPASVPDPPPPPPGPEPPGRARGRVDVPTQEHPPPGETGGAPAALPPEPTAEPEPEPLDAEGGPAVYDFETDEDSLTYTPPADTDDDFEALGPAEEEAPYLDEEEPDAEEPPSPTEGSFDEPGTEIRPAPDDEEETYEGGALESEEPYEGDTDDDLWFEKGPPKDFDFDD